MTPDIRVWNWNLQDLMVEDFRMMALIDESYTGVAELIELITVNYYCGVPKHGLGRWFRK